VITYSLEEGEFFSMFLTSVKKGINEGKNQEEIIIKDAGNARL